jgi:hypothetical protein
MRSGHVVCMRLKMVVKRLGVCTKSFSVFVVAVGLVVEKKADCRVHGLRAAIERVRKEQDMLMVENNKGYGWSLDLTIVSIVGIDIQV